MNANQMPNKFNCWICFNLFTISFCIDWENDLIKCFAPMKYFYPIHRRKVLVWGWLCVCMLCSRFDYKDSLHGMRKKQLSILLNNQQFRKEKKTHIYSTVNWTSLSSPSSSLSFFFFQRIPGNFWIFLYNTKHLTCTRTA